MSSANVSPNFGTNHTGIVDPDVLSVALIGPDEQRRSAVARALADTRRVIVREFDSYPPEPEYFHRLQATFDVIMLDLDSEPEVVMEIVEKASARDAARVMVYSEQADQKLAIRLMRAGAREFLLLPLERGAMAEALARTASNSQLSALPEGQNAGGLLVFVGSKGGSGVTTVACNVAIALAQKSDQKVLLIDLAIPIGDAALCLGISAGYSTEDALRNIDRLDSSLLQNLLVRHRSGIFVLAAPTKVPEVEFSREAIDRLIAIARREFDHVIVDVGSRIDEAAKVLFEDASTIYLITQTGISELRNSNRLISQFFTEGNPNLQIVINRFESRFLEAVNEDVIAKALGRPVLWKIPDDQDAARALQHSDAGIAETRISRISMEMASSITGHPIQQEWKMDFAPRSVGRSAAQVNSPSYEPPAAPVSTLPDAHKTPTIEWPAPNSIAYGEKLTFAQLNATASAAGTLVYTPGPGYVLPVGTHTLWVTFTPEDSVGYSPIQAAVSIVVAQATPVISWRAPAEIIYGAELDVAQLNASASVPGKFSYSPGLGEVLPPGTHKLSVDFTPADGANYAAAQSSVSLSVAKVRSPIQWPKPDPITYGTQLSKTQLCAVSTVPGTFEYQTGLGAVLAAGEHKLSVVFTPADTSGHSPSHTFVSLTVNKATPAIAWHKPEPVSHGASLGPTQLNAAATVPGSFSYSPAVGETLEPGAHELTVKFTPSDTLNYTSARAVVTFTVNAKVPPLITWPGPAAIFYGTALEATQLNATAEVPGTFTYTPSAGLVLAPGRYTLTATFTPSDTEKYATGQAAVALVVEESPDIAALPSAPDESPDTPALPSIKSAPADSEQAHEAGDPTAAAVNARETRMYKGAVYEKREDGQWHLQKN